MSITKSPFWVIAHGARVGGGPLNTLEGIIACIKLGVDGVEVDARLTLDGHFVLSHDAQLVSADGVTLDIAERTLNDIREFCARKNLPFATLDEAIDIVTAHNRTHEDQSVTLCIDVKNWKGEVSSKLKQVVGGNVAELIPPIADRLDRLSGFSERLANALSFGAHFDTLDGHSERYLKALQGILDESVAKGAKADDFMVMAQDECFLRHFIETRKHRYLTQASMFLPTLGVEASLKYYGERAKWPDAIGINADVAQFNQYNMALANNHGVLVLPFHVDRVLGKDGELSKEMQRFCTLRMDGVNTEDLAGALACREQLCTQGQDPNAQVDLSLVRGWLRELFNRQRNYTVTGLEL